MSKILTNLLSKAIEKAEGRSKQRETKIHKIHDKYYKLVLKGNRWCKVEVKK